MRFYDSEIKQLLELRLEIAEDVAEKMQKSLQKTEDSLEEAEAKIYELRGLLWFMLLMFGMACAGIILMMYVK